MNVNTQAPEYIGKTTVRALQIYKAMLTKLSDDDYMELILANGDSVQLSKKDYLIDNPKVGDYLVFYYGNNCVTLPEDVFKSLYKKADYEH